MVSQDDADTSSHTTGRMSSSKARVQIVGRVSGRRNWTVEQKLAIIGEAFASGSSVGSTLERHEISRCADNRQTQDARRGRRNQNRSWTS
jgi:transposase-like protein